jgi:hypothetical protein
MHCCPPALAPHVEWALAGVLGHPARLSWSAQPAAASQLRAQAAWTGPVGTGARLAGALRAWPMLRYEVTEDPSAANDGERLAHEPGRGFHRCAISANGDVLVSEERLRGLLERSTTADDFAHGIHELLGTEWTTSSSCTVRRRRSPCDAAPPGDVARSGGALRCGVPRCAQQWFEPHGFRDESAAEHVPGAGLPSVIAVASDDL